MEKKYRKTISLNALSVKMLEDIKRKNGFFTDAEAVRFTISDTHKREFKDYVVARGKKGDPEKQRVEAGRDICVQLGGSVGDKDGKAVCRFYTYGRRERFEQVVPLEEMTEDLIETQYFPSKEYVKDLQLKGKVNYEV